MLKEFDLSFELPYNEKSFIYECENNVTILVTAGHEFSVKKELLSVIKLDFELNNLTYEIIPKKYLKYYKFLKSIADNGNIYVQPVCFSDGIFYIIYKNGYPITEKLNNTKYNSENDIIWYSKETIEAAKKYKFNIIYKGGHFDQS